MSTTSTHLLRASLAAIARLEAAGDKPARLTQPDFAEWARFRRKLDWGDFIRLLHQDAAQSFPEPFDVDRWQSDPFADLEDGTAKMLVGDAASPSKGDRLDFLSEQARGLELAGGGKISELPKVQPRERVLELGGGRIAAHQCHRRDELAFDKSFVFVAASPAERVLIGLAAVELRANPPTIVWATDLEARLPELKIDRVFGLEDRTTDEATRAALAPIAEVRWV